MNKKTTIGLSFSLSLSHSVWRIHRSVDEKKNYSKLYNNIIYMYTRYTYIHTHTCIIDWYSMLNNCRHKQSLLALTMNELTDHAQKAGTPCREATYRHRNSFIHRKRQCRYQDIYLYWIEIERKRVRERHSEMPIQNSPCFNIIYWNSNPNSNLFLHFFTIIFGSVAPQNWQHNTTPHSSSSAQVHSGKTHEFDHRFGYNRAHRAKYDMVMLIAF